MESYIKPEHIEKWIQQAVVFLPRIPIAILLFAIGLFAIGFFTRALRFTLLKRKVEPTLVSFLTSLVSAILKVLLVISVASTVGIATTSFIAMIGAAGLAIGLALQGSLSNFAGSVILMIFKPFKVGDVIAAQNQEGQVKDINIFNTVITTGDNRRVIIPNGPLASGVIVNVTAESLRRVDITIGVGYNDNIPKVKNILQKLASEDMCVLMNPNPPFIGISKFGESSVDLVFRVWVRAVDYWPTYYSMMEKIKESFEKENIEIPFPQRSITLLKSEDLPSSSSSSPPK